MASTTFFDADAITKEHVEAQLNKIGSEERQDFLKVYAAAADFVTRYIQILEQAQAKETAKGKSKGIVNLLARVKGLQGSELINYLDGRNGALLDIEQNTTAKEIEALLFKEQSKFYSIVNKTILGQTIDFAVVYVNVNNNTVEIYNTTDETLMNRLSISSESGKSGGLQAKINPGIFHDVEASSEEGKKINVQGLKVAYLEALKRFLYSGKIRRVMWYLNNKWNKMKVSAAGD